MRAKKVAEEKWRREQNLLNLLKTKFIARVMVHGRYDRISARICIRTDGPGDPELLGARGAEKR